VIFPGHLKISVVRTLSIKGDKAMSMSNYRPISLLTTFSKVLQKVMHSRLSHYLQANKILEPAQFDFKKAKSIENVAFELADNILKQSETCMLDQYSVVWQKLSIL
jgi:hypothetical protein